MAKSNKDKPADKGAAEDSLTAADTVTSEAPDTDDTLPGEAGEDSLAADTAEESAPDSGDSLTADAEDDTLSAGPQDESLSDGHDTLAPDTDDTVTGDVDKVPDTASAGFGSGDPADTDPEAREDDVPHEGGDIAAGQADDTLSSDDTLDAAMAPAAAPASAEPKVIRETVVERKGGFIPMLLGGIVAAGVGYVAGAYPDLPFLGVQAVEEDPFVTETRATLRDQGARIDTLAERADANAAAIDGIDLDPISSSVTALEGGLDAANTSLTSLEANLTDRIAALETRVTELEKQPLRDAVSPEAIAAYEGELDALRAQIDAQQADLAAAQAEQQAAMDAAREEVEAMAARAREAEASAETRARLAGSRAALADLTTRARDGEPYAEALGVLTSNGVDVPGPLAEGAEDGLPTASALISSFPDAARDALAAARATGDATAEGLGGFLRNQLGARSVTPRDGDDPDAVLSRAEAALKGGDLDTTLSEIEALPEAARTEMSDWVAQARLRRDALAAAADLAQQLNQE